MKFKNIIALACTHYTKNKNLKKLIEISFMEFRMPNLEPSTYILIII